jgi:hypothetical protein
MNVPPFLQTQKEMQGKVAIQEQRRDENVQQSESLISEMENKIDGMALFVMQQLIIKTFSLKPFLFHIRT